MTNNTKVIRYCSECGTIGAVPATKQNCCSAANPTFIPHDIAIQAHAGFHAAAGLHRARQNIVATNTVGLKVVDDK